MNKYELVVVLTIEDKNAKKSVDAIIEQLKFKIVDQEDMETRDLAYPIKKQAHGAYHKLILEGEGSMVVKLENELNLSESVLRHLVVALPPKLERIRAEMAVIRKQIQAKKAKEEADEVKKEQEEADEVENSTDEE